MFFKRIEIHGFKSFAEPTVIEFDRGITCVVGPNGSGKSNICDAIRWVLGAQSAKALRGDKMEDVIFAGTASRKSRGMAEVTLVIDNSDGALEIDYNEVAITRRMYRSGESEYLINNNICRMRDIRELIMDTGIGVEGYSIIGQGKISDIISNNTESIREILEETAGISMYRSRKADAERRLSSATTNMERVTDIIGEIEGRIDKLRDDSEKATRYLELRDRHRELEINITLNNIEGIKEKNKDIAEDLQKLEQDINDVKIKRDEINQTIAQGLAGREELENRIEEHRMQQQAAGDELADLIRKNEVRSERLSAIERDSKRLVQEIQDLEEKIAQETSSSSDLFAEKKRWEDKLETLSRELAQKTNSFASAQATFTRREETIDEKKNELIDLEREASSKNAEVASIRSLKENLLQRKAEIENEKGTGEDTSKNQVDSLGEAKQARERIRIELETLKNEKEELRARHAEDIQKERLIAQTIEETKVKIGQVEERKRTYEEMESNYEGYNNAVKFIMKEEMRGIEGTVAELTDVPDGYEVAMDTALGGNVQNIVCSDSDVAKRAIGMLKSEKAGRLTFLPLDQITSKGVKKGAAINTAPGFKGYGVDCLKYDEKYRIVMEYLLGNVVVMDNINNAVALAKRVEGYKLVTMEGEIISPSGSMTGGQHQHSSANIFERKADINKLEAEISELAQNLREGEAEAVSLRTAIENAQRNMTAKDEEIASKERESFAKENEITILNTQLTEYASQDERWVKELENIETETRSADGSIRELNEQVRQLNGRIGSLKTQIESSVTEHERQKESIDEQQAAITEARIEVTTCENEKARVDALTRRIEESLGFYRADKERKTDEKRRLAEEKSELDRAASEGASSIDAANRKKEELDQTFAAMQEERQAAIEKGNEDAQVKEELDAKALALSNQKNELDIRQARQDTQLENAKNKLWEEFEISYAQAIDLRAEEFVMSRAVQENRDIKRELKELGEVNVGAIEEYKEVSERYEFLAKQRDDIDESMRQLNRIINDMDRIIHTKFKESFDDVVENFDAVFNELYGGGHAKISFADEGDPFESEIEITAQPPGKQLKHINLLSGGEKTMTAIALMFAVLKTKPTPCCILDEVEAALDDSNLDIFGKYIRSFEGVQFTLITHQKQTMEHADVMYGITMPEGGISKVYSLRMEDEEESA